MSESKRKVTHRRAGGASRRAPLSALNPAWPRWRIDRCNHGAIRDAGQALDKCVECGHTAQRSRRAVCTLCGASA